MRPSATRTRNQELVWLLVAITAIAALAALQAPRRPPFRLKSETPNSVIAHFRKLQSLDFLTLDRSQTEEYPDWLLKQLDRGLGTVCDHLVVDARRTNKVHEIVSQIVRADANVGRSYPRRKE